MNAPIWTVAALLSGMALMFVGPLCVSQLPTQAVWSDEQAEAYTKAGNALHSASYGARHTHSPGAAHSHAPPPADDSALKAIREAYELERSKLESAQSRSGWLRWTMRLLGAAVCGVGVWGYWRAKQAA